MSSGGCWREGPAYVVALIATAPAALLDANLQRASHGRLRLAEARGTLWTGAGQLEIREADGRGGIGRGITWRATPASLLRGRLAYDVGMGRAGATFPVTLSWSGIEAANVDVNLPATVLGLAVPRLAPLGLTGELLIRVAQLSLASGRMDGHATLRWRAAGSALTPLSPLGEYEMRLDGADTKVQALLTTLAGPLQLDGKGAWRQGDSIAFRATARVPQQHLRELAPLLRLIAVEKGKGTFELELK